VGPFRLGESRAAAHRADRHVSSHGRVQQDFFCLTPIGIRAGYGFRRVLQGVPRAEARRLTGAIVLLLTGNRRYALRGIRPGTPLRIAARRTRLSRPIRMGPNTWYLTANGSSRGLLRVRHGVADEVGIAVNALTRTPAQARRLLAVFG
jgi:hypothetical protein